MAATNGRYYLICNYDKYDTLSNYRIDRITGIKMLDENRKPVRELKEREINLPKHMAEHLYMFAGESIHAKFQGTEPYYRPDNRLVRIFAENDKVK